MRTARILESGLRFKDIKYKLIGITPAPRADAYGLPEWSETDTLQYLRQTRILAQSIIQQLSQMTDLSQSPLELPAIRAGLSNGIDSTKLEKLISMGEETPNSLATVIPQLTQHDLGPRATERISIWLYSLFKLGNKLSANQSCFNSVIGYFLATNDWQMASFALRRMLDHDISPNRVTLHLLLKFQALKVQHNPYPVGVFGHPLIGTHRCLQSMDHLGVRADQTTWNYVLQCMPLGFGKSFLIEEMDKRDIALNSDSRRAILQTVIEDRKSSNNTGELPIPLLECLDPADPNVVQLLVDYMLSCKTTNNENVRRAWSFLESSEIAEHEKKSTAMMNTWLRRFAARRHLDWQFGLLSFFNTTIWDNDSWQYLLEAASFCKEQPAKYLVLGTLLKQAERENVPLTSRSRYLARRALRKAAVGRYQFRDLGSTGLSNVKNGLQWESLFKAKNPSLLKTIGFPSETDNTATTSQETPLPSQLVTSFDESRFDEVPRTDTPHRREQLTKFLKCT